MSMMSLSLSRIVLHELVDVVVVEETAVVVVVVVVAAGETRCQ
jgi:hypothetical protein